MSAATASHGSGGFFSQPKAVWAVAFAAVVSFMGLGLVDPILPAIAEDLHASPSQVELLFTSYFAVTGISMLVTSAVAARIGAKRTLIAGLVLIILFSAAAGLSDSIGAIVGLRAGWGLGNALFIATALSVIIGSASGGVAGAVVLYEAALGLGISVGPLLGGELGSISWRGPFFGVAVLMAIGLVATAVFLPRTPPDPHARRGRTSVLDPLRALRFRATRGSALVALFYNFGFFTLLAYTPFPLGLGAHELGLVFCGWGVVLAIFSVFVAPRVSRRLGDGAGLGVSLGLVALILLVMGLGHDSQAVLIGCVVAAGSVLGIANTLLTQVVMETAAVERPVASAAYSFVRFTGGAVAPFLAGKLGEHIGVGVPFYVGAGMVLISIGVLAMHRDSLEPPPVAARAADRPERPAPVLVAVGGSDALAVTELAVPVALERGGEAHLVHVAEVDVAAGEGVAEHESAAAAAELLERCVQAMRSAGVAVSGEAVESVGDHLRVADAIVAAARGEGADTVVLGADRTAAWVGRVAERVAAERDLTAIVVDPRHAGSARP